MFGKKGFKVNFFNLCAFPASSLSITLFSKYTITKLTIWHYIEIWSICHFDCYSSTHDKIRTIFSKKRSGTAPANSLELALLATLATARYSAQSSGSDHATAWNTHGAAFFEFSMPQAASREQRTRVENENIIGKTYWYIWRNPEKVCAFLMSKTPIFIIRGTLSKPIVFDFLYLFVFSHKKACAVNFADYIYIFLRALFQIEKIGV